VVKIKFLRTKRTIVSTVIDSQIPRHTYRRFLNSLRACIWVCICIRDGNRPCDFARSNCQIYIKSGNMVRKSGKIWKNYQQNRRKSELLH